MDCKKCNLEFSTKGAKELHMRVFHPNERKMIVERQLIGRKFERIVGNIEDCFYAFREKNISLVAFGQIKDWINDHTKNGISSPRLANFLRRRPQFKLAKKFRKIGTNQTESYWCLNDGNNPDTDANCRGQGWVEVSVEA